MIELRTARSAGDTAGHCLAIMTLLKRRCPLLLPVMRTLWVCVVVMTGCDAIPEQRDASGMGLPDLAIAKDSSTGRADFTLSELRLKNYGNAVGVATVSLVVFDKGGQQLGRFAAHSSSVSVAAAGNGGLQGRTVSLLDARLFRNLVDSLLEARSEFGIQVELTTQGIDADPRNNMAAKEWRVHQSLRPNTRIAISMPTITGDGASCCVTARVVGVPFGIQISLDGDVLTVISGTHLAAPVAVTTSEFLTYGKPLVALVTLRTADSNRPARMRELVAVYDTTPPLLTNARMLLFRNGQIALQVHAMDRHAGVPEGGVVASYSTNGGHSWDQRTLHATYDDFRRPAVFEGLIGPVPQHDSVVVSISARDIVGNTTNNLPSDVGVLLAPVNTEYVYAELVGSSILGHPLFDLEGLAALSRELSREASALPAEPDEQQARLGSELRATRDDSALIGPFVRWGVPTHPFPPVASRVAEIVVAGVPRRAVVIPSWR